MKKTALLFATFALSFGMISCSDDDDDSLRILTFEDEDFRGEQSKKWSTLIDDKQNNGTLLYSGKEYSWYDENNTFLSSAMLDGEYGCMFWNGGHAVSNYVEKDLAKGDTDHQLSVYTVDGNGNGGHNGSRNFCVQNGYRSDFNPLLPQLKFKDGIERIIDHMYVANTTYTKNVYINGNEYSKAAGDEDNMKIVATGFDKDGKATRTAEFILAEGKAMKDGWNRFDLSVLGKVLYVEFDIVSTIGNDFGMSVPAYFAFDDVAVRMD